MKPGESLSVGHLLDGRYRINKMLGQGGMGRVYLANDTRLANRPVACKEMIIGDGIQEQKAVEDFNREARVLASLTHPSIPQVIDYFGERGRHYLVMEFVAGGDLQRQLEKLGAGGRFPEAKVVRWARQILDVLHFLHAQAPPIVYRDLKPGNIMIDSHGRAMLVDFGIARFLPPGGRGTQIGSVGYAPPEQYLGRMEPRSDLYSLAATMHHLLTARDPQLEPPFSFPPIRSLAPAVSIETGNAVMRALEKDVDKRPQSALEMRDLLPNPGLDEASPDATFSDAGAISRSAPASSSAASGIGAIETIVLNRPAASAPSAKPNPARGAGAFSHLVAKKLSKASISNQKTQLSLKSPSPQPVPSTSQSARSAAHSPGGGAAKVSPTAKTQDLGIKPARPAPAASPPNRPVAQVSSPETNPRPASRITAPDASPARPGLTPAAKRGKPSGLQVHQGLSKTASSAVSAARHRVARGAENGFAGARLMIAGEGAPQFSLAGDRWIIGRMADAADVVDIDLSGVRRGVDRVSRRHAEIIRRGDEYFIRDLGSLNGTYISGRGKLGRDQLYRLKDRDEVVIGGAKMEFRKG